MIERLEISKIRVDGGTQSRAEIVPRVVNQYKEAYSEAEDMPPITVFHDGAAYWLADGFHRYHAAVDLGLSFIETDLIQGSQRDAILFSVGANARHGLQRTPSDKRRAVLRLLRDEEWANRSDRWIAEKCAVSHSFVSDVRASLPDQVESSEPAKRTGKDGKTYPKAQIQVESTPPEPEFSFSAPRETAPRELSVRERKPELEEVFTDEQRRALDSTVEELWARSATITEAQMQALDRLSARHTLLLERQANGEEWRLLFDDYVALYVSLDAEPACDEKPVVTSEAALTTQEPIGAVDARIAELEADLEQAYAATEAARTEALENALRLQNAVRANEQLRGLIAGLEAQLKTTQEALAKPQPRPAMSFRSFVLEFALLDRQTCADIAAYVIEKNPGMAAKASRHDADRDSDYRGDLDNTPLMRASTHACACTLAIPPHGEFTPTGQEEELVGKGGVGEKPKKRAAAKKALTTYPESFEVTEQMRTWATEQHPTVNLDVETEKFTDHHVAKGSKFADWPAAWRNWIRRAEEFAPKASRQGNQAGQALMIQTPSGEVDISRLPYAAQNDIYRETREEQKRKDGVAMQLAVIARMEARKEERANAQRRV